MMKFFVAALLVVSVSAMDVTPLQKVISMLDGMLAKGKKEKHEEEVEFAKFHEWCSNLRSNTEKAIEEGSQQIEQLSADISKAAADAEELAAEIATLEETIVKNQAELDAAAGIRKKERADFMAQETDLSESIDAIERAIATLKAKEADVPQSLLQVQNSKMLPQHAKAAIESFLAMAEGSEADGTPEANAYENQSGGVVALLEKLRLKFQDEKEALTKAEMSAKANFQQLEQRLVDNLKEDKSQVEKKTSQKAGRLEDKASAEGELKITEETKVQDMKTLSDTNAKCKFMSEEFENNQGVRSAEIKAIKEATKILSSDAVTGNADKHLPASLLQKATALVQLRGVDTPAAQEARKELIEFLQGKAKSSGSKYLALIAQHAEADPFAKVKKMIKDLITKLMEETNAEADHKAYCDTELATNKQTREIKQSEVDELSASIEKLTAESTDLGEEIGQLTEALADLTRSQAEATKNRKDEKAVNTETIADAKTAQLAVEKATQVLKEFYNQHAAALLQGGEEASLQQEMSSAARAPYKGQQAGAGGIVGFLEVVLSDFARLEAETSQAESAAATSYQQFMDESSEDMAVKETEKNHKDEKRQSTDGTIASEKKELELTQGELDAALEYYEKLKPDCLDMGLSYEDRVRLREEELQSLKEALQILGQQELA
jgi:hypothetical protein